uniref:Reverse transcriptase domain-containing protein n=1 Tax=Tanacetum cinerariifolium TaxID=118510 RepID=A0A6L2JUX6_TANCI|nr:reverse transcriptase domain-containing protein [Tanacetum cinerariifolium]
MSTRSTSTDLVPPFSDPESVIRNSQRNLGDPSLLLDFDEINMANDNNVQGPPPVGAAWTWLKKEPPNSITTWNDLVSKDPRKFLIPCVLQDLKVCSSLSDFEASINLIPLLIYEKLGIEPLKPTQMTLELANRSVTYPMGIAKDVIVKVDKFNFLADFVIVDFEADPRIDTLTPVDRSDSHHEEFADELAHIISPPEYDYFFFDIEVDPGELTRLLIENSYSKNVNLIEIKEDNELKTKKLTKLGLVLHLRLRPRCQGFKSSLGFGCSINTTCHVAHSGGAMWQSDPDPDLTLTTIDRWLTGDLMVQRWLIGCSPSFTGGSGSEPIISLAKECSRRPRGCSRVVVNGIYRLAVAVILEMDPEATIANDWTASCGPNILAPDLRSMEELLQAPTDGVGDEIIVPLVLASQIKLKIALLNLVTAISFHGFDNDDPHSHIRRFTRITQTIKLNQVSHDIIKLILFPFSLEGAARTWLKKESPNSITTWNDLVSKFVNQFFPPSRTTNLRNEITKYQQRFSETFTEARDRFKDILNKCPHYGFSLLRQIDTFYNGLNQSNQDSLNSAAGGNFLTRNTQKALTIIENQSKVRTSRNKPQASIASDSSSQNDAITTFSRQVEALSKQILSINKPIHAIQESCKTCGGPHAYYECQAAGCCTQDVYATTGNFNAAYSTPSSIRHTQFTQYGVLGYLTVSFLVRLLHVKMDDPNINMEEYIRIEKEKARRNGKVYNWETATYSKIWYDEDVHNLRSVETEFPAIVFDNALTSKVTPSYEPTVSSLNDIEIDFRISFDESDDEDYTEENILYFNDLFPFKVIYPDDLKSDKENDDDKIDIKQSSVDMSIIPLPNVINTEVGAYARGSNMLLETSHDTSNKFFKTKNFIKELNVNIVASSYLNKGMEFIFLIKNLYVSFGIPFDPKLFYKDGINISVNKSACRETTHNVFSIFLSSLSSQTIYMAYPNPIDTAY